MVIQASVANVESGGQRLLHPVSVAAMAFLTVVDLFAAQAILPLLTTRYHASAAAAGTAVNASTIGMAIGSLLLARYGQGIDPRRGICLALAVLAIPTSCLAAAPDLAVFAGLRIAQGLCMACAFTLTLAHFARETDSADRALLFAAYVTGNVASNLVGRLLSATLADLAGVASSFQAFAVLNVIGAILGWLVIAPSPSPVSVRRQGSALLPVLKSGQLRAAFVIGFCILFAFVGTFTYINFVLVRPPLALGMMSLGLVYLVFLPAIATTPLAGRLSASLGNRTSILLGLGIALLGTGALTLPHLWTVLAGLVIIGIGTFLAQAATTGLVGRTGNENPSAAAGLYLTAYFSGGLVGSVLLGGLFNVFGWTATVIGIGSALLLAIVLAASLQNEG